MNKVNNFKRHVLTILFFTTAQSNSNQHSLGRACGVAGTLREFNFRNQAYPFDWVVTPFNALYKMIKTDFSDFLKDDSLTIRSDGSAVVDSINQIEFVHDFPTKHSFNQSENDAGATGPIVSTFLDYLAQIKAKYNRKITRFINACQSNNKVVFIRNRDITMQQAVHLCVLFTKKYPHLDYILVLIDDENKMSSELDTFHPRIKNFYGSPYINYDDDKQTINWKLILDNLGLISEK